MKQSFPENYEMLLIEISYLYKIILELVCYRSLWRELIAKQFYCEAIIHGLHMIRDAV